MKREKCDAGDIFWVLASTNVQSQFPQDCSIIPANKLFLFKSVWPGQTKEYWTILPIFSCTWLGYTSFLVSIRISCLSLCYSIILEFSSLCLEFPPFHSLLIKTTSYFKDQLKCLDEIIAQAWTKEQRTRLYREFTWFYGFLTFNLRVKKCHGRVLKHEWHYYFLH